MLQGDRCGFSTNYKFEACLPHLKHELLLFFLLSYISFLEEKNNSTTTQTKHQISLNIRTFLIFCQFVFSNSPLIELITGKCKTQPSFTFGINFLLKLMKAIYVYMQGV